MDALRAEKKALVSAMKEKHVHARHIQPTTPTFACNKRGTFHSPTPRKTKKALFSTPSKTFVPVPSTSTQASANIQLTVHAKPTTKSAVRLFSPTKVKVSQ